MNHYTTATKYAKAVRLKGEGFEPGEWKNKITVSRQTGIGFDWVNNLSLFLFVTRPRTSETSKYRRLADPPL